MLDYNGFGDSDQNESQFKVYLLTINKRRTQLRKRKVYDDNYKARVALEAIKGEKTISEIAGQFEVHPNQIVKWKKQLLENVTSLFSKKKDPEIEEQKKLLEELYKKIGKQNIELEFLKKKYKQLQSL